MEIERAFNKMHRHTHTHRSIIRFQVRAVLKKDIERPLLLSPRFSLLLYHNDVLTR